MYSQNNKSGNKKTPRAPRFIISRTFWATQTDQCIQKYFQASFEPISSEYPTPSTFYITSPNAYDALDDSPLWSTHDPSTHKNPHDDSTAYAKLAFYFPCVINAQRNAASPDSNALKQGNDEDDEATGDLAATLMQWILERSDLGFEVGDGGFQFSFGGLCGFAIAEIGFSGGGWEW
ncbi:hypothetical protein SNOG_01304 [Parastagonospora nodorum SN15]|uniref:Uncharacterized protein n=1 Tax=Phaeosphaeria nodorum (strain SN15 / ATCC MYA-4574 / FGSC 10173) TaxID=321614 RepID=Q0V3W0_PHANO|nr:hypothetical protein SNOG_01304 [Parastagonospora nodorum SN15]EAT90953.1 hypothetical protein SNOG_01304 [Parastagonospora nodorum SN15]